MITLDGADAGHPLTSLPLARWAARFRAGQGSLVGALGSTLDLAGYGVTVAVQPGEVSLLVGFAGGDAPTLTRVIVRGALVGPAGLGRVLALHGGRALLDGVDVGSGTLRPTQAAVALASSLANVALRAEARAGHEVVVKLAPGLRVTVPREVSVTATARASGEASMLRLDAPLEVRIGGAGVLLQVAQLRRLSELARVHIAGARLHPDGQVDLEGGARGLLGAAVRGGLDQAGAGLSHLVRTSERFHRVRRYLRPTSASDALGGEGSSGSGL